MRTYSYKKSGITLGERNRRKSAWLQCILAFLKMFLIATLQIFSHKDTNQRPGCGCVESVEIGSYDCCTLGCKYCYATSSGNVVQANVLNHNPEAPVLFGNLPKNAIISEKKMLSIKDEQIRLF